MFPGVIIGLKDNLTMQLKLKRIGNNINNNVTSVG